MKVFFKKNIGGILAIFFLLLVLIGLIVCIVMAVQEQQEYNNWYSSLSPEEQQAEKEKHIQRYEVINADKYIQTKTNGFGGVTGSEVCYTFQYIDNGKLKTVDGFRDLEYGLTRVIIGDKNMYIIDDSGVDTYRYLQLTKETLSKMNLVSNN